MVVFYDSFFNVFMNCIPVFKKACINVNVFKKASPSCTNYINCTSVCPPVMTCPTALASPMLTFWGGEREGSQEWVQSGKGSGESRPWQVNNLTEGEQSRENSQAGCRKGAVGRRASREDGCQEREGWQAFEVRGSGLGQVRGSGRSRLEWELQNLRASTLSHLYRILVLGNLGRSRLSFIQPFPFNEILRV